MFEPNMLRDDTSDVVSRTWNFGDASSLVHRARHSAGLLDRSSSLPPREGVELSAGRPFPTERCQP